MPNGRLIALALPCRNDGVTATHLPAVLCRPLDRAFGFSRSLCESHTLLDVFRRSRPALMLRCIVAIVAFALLPEADAAQSDRRIPWLPGIQAITMSVNVIIDGSGTNTTSPCQLDRNVFEHHYASMLHDVGLDAIGAVDELAKQRELLTEFNKAFDDVKLAQRDGKPAWDREQSAARTRKEGSLADQPFLFIRAGIETIDGGLCAAGRRRRW